MHANEIFTPYAKSIEKVFCDSDSFYKMPNYQRPYSWEDEHIDQLMDDLYTAYESYESSKSDEEPINPTYFLGSMILIPHGDAYDVVDGQQRLTTLTILFCVFKQFFGNFLSQKTQNLLKESIISGVKEKQRLKLTTSIYHQNDFEDEVINGIDIPEQFTKKDKRNKKYLNAAVIIKNTLGELENSELEKFVNYIFNNTKLITIECSSKTLAIKLFQVLNTRGLELSVADLTKSFLLSNLDETKHEQFISTWRTIEDMSNQIDEEISDLLTYYEYYLLGSKPKQSLYDELEIIFSKKINDGITANEIIQNFKNFTSTYLETVGEQEKKIQILSNLSHKVYWRSILTTAKFEGFKAYDELKEFLVRYYYLYWIAGHTAAKIKNISFSIIKWIKLGKDFSYIEQQLNEKLEKDNVLSNFMISMTSDVSNEAWLKPLLIAVEYQQTDHIVLTKYGRDLHIEHVLPIKFMETGYWTNLYSEEYAQNLLNKIGNVTLLSGIKNIQASNKSFRNKRKIYNGKGIDGITSFRITQYIYDEYSSWIQDELLDRHNWIISEIGKLFNVDLTSIQYDKIDDIVYGVQN